MNKENNNEGKGTPKWIYAVIVALILGFGVYGYFKVNTWLRYAAIESSGKPITGYLITKVYSKGKTTKIKGREVHDEDEEESDIDYFMELSYQGKDYRLVIDKQTYTKYNDGSGEVTLYYDPKGDDIFVAGTGGGNLLVTALGAIVVLIAAFIYIVLKLFKLSKRKRQ